MQERRYSAALKYTYLLSISFPVAMSVTTSRTQGGGVIGRRSYRAISGLLTVHSAFWKGKYYFVSKATHAGSSRLLGNIKAWETILA